MKIVLITIGQPSTNPRAVKEANALSAAGYQVTVLYCFWIGWAIEADKKLLGNVKWQYKLVGGAPGKNNWLLWYTKIEVKLFRFINKWLGNKWGIAEIAQAKCYRQLLHHAKAIKADWYIAHILGALPVAVKAAQYNKAKAGFDFEDYHRAENDSMSKVEINRIVFLENKYIPALQYISAASPLILQQVKLNFPAFAGPLITLNNTFSKEKQPPFVLKEITDKSFQLFWFSQTVGEDRGIEIILDALKELNDDTIQLTLVGSYTEQIKNSFSQRAGNMAANVYFIGTVGPDDIPGIAANMDIGLSLEQTIPYNRDICLTNKIFTYLQSGNAVLLTNTQAQTQFNQQYNVGAVCNIGNVQAVCAVLKNYKNNPGLLLQQRKKNWQLANESLNWENESKKLLEVIQ